jgi:uncharacterized protein
MQASLTDWFKVESGECHLIGTQCSSCGAYYFPPQLLGCRVQSCTASNLRPVPLSNTGALWSFTTLYEKPPPPFVEAEHFSRLSVVIVELAVQKLKVIGYLEKRTDPSSLKIGQRMQLAAGDRNQGETVDYGSLQWRVMDEIDGQ